jgi:integrase
MHGTVDKYRVSTKHADTGRYDRWRIRWELPPDPYTGERRRGSQAGFPTRRSADRRLAEIMGEVSAATYVAPSRDRLGAYLTGWLTALSVKPTTLDNYRTAAEVHVIPRLGGIALADLRAEHVDQLYRELERHGKRAGKCRTAGVTCKPNGCKPDRHDGLSPKAVRHVHTMLRKALQDAVDRGYLGRNVADLANPPTQRAAASRGARDKVWTTDQLRTFLAATAHERLWPIWQLMATTGLRRAEMLGLRWPDVDLDRARLHVARTVTEVRGRLIVQEDGKTDAAQRSLALDDRTVEALRGWQERQAEELLDRIGELPHSGVVFTGEDGERLRPQRVSSAFSAASDRIGLPHIGVHGLRHSYATAALRAGVSPEVVSKRLGHASVIITLSLYAHVFEQDDQAAADLAARAIYGPQPSSERSSGHGRVMGGT